MNAPSELLKQWALKAPGRRALVLGAGEGAEAVWLSQQGFKVDAVERDPQRVAALVEATAGMRVTVWKEDIQVLDIPSSEYALVVALAVLHFVPPHALRDVAGRMAGGLVPGGLLLLQVLTDKDPSAEARRRRGDPERSPNTFELDGGMDQIHYFVRGELVALFSGLRHLDHEVYRFAAPGRPDGFGAGEILVAERFDASGT